MERKRGARKMKKALAYSVHVLAIPLLFYYLTINLLSVLPKTWNEMMGKLNEVAGFYIEEMENDND